MIEQVEWIPCHERMPEDGQDVLMFGPDPGVHAGTFDDADQLPYPHFRDVDDCAVEFEVTHWAAMPSGPMPEDDQ